jgi:fructose/tagatose bisphosphate aldolase
MPLTRVRDLVRHASQHGYLVASFKVHGAEEVQAVVNAAEAARAPAIVAVDEQGTALLRRDITLAVAESVAAAASVPIAVEVVSHAQDGGLISSRTDSVAVDVFSPVSNTAPYDLAEERDQAHEADAQDREMWFALPAAVAEITEAAAAGCRLGLSAGETGEAGLRPAALRKRLQSLRARHQAALVADGDLPWPGSAFRSLPGLGIAKINFDKRLAQVMAKANRRAAQKAGDQYRVAVKETFTALTEEVIECLRRAGGSGRAADVMACAGDENQGPAPAHLRPCRRTRGTPRTGRMRLAHRHRHPIVQRVILRHRR